MRTRLIVLAIIASVIGLGFYTGLFKYLNPESLSEVAESAGVWGPIVITLLFIVLEPFAVPGAIFMLTATALYPAWIVFLVSWIGGIGAGMFGFGFARYFARDWVSGRLPERLRKWDQRLSTEGLPVVIVFRMMFFLNPASHWALGLSSVPFPTAALGTAIGFLPWMAAWAFFGAQIMNWFERNSIELILGVALAVGAVIALTVFILRRRAAATLAAVSSEATS